MYQCITSRSMAVAVLLACVLLLSSCCCLYGAVLRRTWTTQPWCESARKPQWPFAYQKTPAQTLEWQGRANPNDQDIRHACGVFGVQSKCHICEDFACNGNSGDRCAFQLQGIPWSTLPKNVPTVTDVPWAVGANTATTTAVLHSSACSCQAEAACRRSRRTSRSVT